MEVLKSLSEIGCSGTVPGNCHRDLTHKLSPTKLHMPTPVKVPMKKNDTEMEEDLQYFMWPHELFGAICHHYRKGWTDSVCPSVRSIEAFWDSQAGSPQLDSDDIRSRLNFRSRCIPIALHGDGEPVTGLGKSCSKMMDVWSWNSMLVQGGTLQCLFYIYGIFHRLVCKLPGYKTYDDIARKFKWSFAQLWLGRYDPKDWNGVPFVED